MTTLVVVLPIVAAENAAVTPVGSPETESVNVAAVVEPLVKCSVEPAVEPSATLTELGELDRLYGETTVKLEVVDVVPCGVVTVIWPETAPDGVWTTIWVAELLMIFAAATPPNFMLLALERLTPVSVTFVPGVPDVGVKELIAAAEVPLNAA